jgi:hypothetical protein
MLRPVAFSLCAAALLSGCGPSLIYYKPGAEVSRLQSDTLSCQTQALQKAPVANEIRQDPPRYFPGRRYCGSSGHCSYYPGYWEQGRIYTVDTNLGLRTRLEQACMAGKGYSQVEVKRCPQRVIDQNGGEFGGPLPSLTPDACVIDGGNGAIRIVQPG